MEFFDKLGETIITAGKDVTQKAKDLSEVAKLKMDIKAKEDFVEKQYAEIGRRYYEAHKDDDILDYGECSVIEEALASIETMKKQLSEVKGTKQCPKCGADVAQNASFCASCGAKIDDFFEE